MAPTSCTIELNGKTHHDIFLSWRNISAVTIPLKKNAFYSCFKTQVEELPKQILNDVSGLAKPGELLAIMGSSGAGKTTLLNILTMRNKSKFTLSGEVYINDKIVTSKLLTATAAYIEQDSLFIGTLSVKEQLIFQARLRMGNNTYAAKLQRVDEVIQELGLAKCQNNLIGIPGRIKGISGGEKRRLAVACEILTNPYLLFCDEPTSGLDSSMAHSVVTLLQNMALKGKTILCTIHQPSSEIYELFDKILFLAEGRVAFLGTGDGALDYFNSLNYKCPMNYNPADYFIHTLAITAEDGDDKRRVVSEICDSFQKSNNHSLNKDEIEDTIKNKILQLPEEDMKSRYTVSWCEQLRAVVWRSCLSVLKEPVLIKMRFIQTLFVGLFLGFFYYHQELTQLSVNNINGAFYILLINTTYQNMYSVIHVFCSELPIFLREHSSGLYGSRVYFLSKVFADQFIFILAPALFIAVSYWLIGFYPDIEKFLLAILIFVLVANSATSVGYLISALSTSTAMAVTLAPACVVPLLLFGGFFIRKMSVQWYLKWIPYLSWFEYGFECLAINQWKDVTHIDCNVDNKTCQRNGMEILHGYDFHPSAFWPNIMSLVGLILTIRMAALLVVAVRAHRTSIV